MTVEEEVERRWPSPNSGLYEGLRIGFKLGAEWQKAQDEAKIEKLQDRVSDMGWDISNAAQAAYEQHGRETW